MLFVYRVLYAFKGNNNNRVLYAFHFERSHFSYFKAECKRACYDAAARMRTPPGKVNIPFRDLIVD